MISVICHNKIHLTIMGEPTHDVKELKKPRKVAVLPVKIPYIKPKLNVGVGESVKIGDPLFTDKKNPRLVFVSPGSGKIDQIRFGNRRVIDTIEILLDDQETYADFSFLNGKDVLTLSRDRLIDFMMQGGMWPYIRSLPFRKIADPVDRPQYIIICLDNHEPFHPNPDVYLNSNLDYFNLGMKILDKLAENIVLHSDLKSRLVQDALKEKISHRYTGCYPSEDPGVILYHIKATSNENLAWYVNGQDVIQIGRFFKHGRFPIERTVTLGGDLADQRQHFNTRMGVPLSLLTDGRVSETGSMRHIVGGIFRGYSSEPTGYLGFYETSLNLLSEDETEEAFGFIRSGYSKPSFSKTFMSAFNPSQLRYDCQMHGEERACVNCGFCSQVCPVDILPQFTMKSIKADEVEEALAHGLLDCVECGFCSYACPSKIELCSVFKQAKSEYYKEIHS